MGRVKSEMFEDNLGPDDELVPLPVSQIVENIRKCDLPTNSVQRYEFMKNQLKELINVIRKNTD